MTRSITGVGYNDAFRIYSRLQSTFPGIVYTLYVYNENNQSDNIHIMLYCYTGLNPFIFLRTFPMCTGHL